MCPEANEEEPFASWDGPATPLSYCFAYLVSQHGFRKEELGSSRLQLWLLGGGERNKGEGLASNLRGREKVPICAKRTGKGNALEKEQLGGEVTMTGLVYVSTKAKLRPQKSQSF